MDDTVQGHSGETTIKVLSIDGGGIRGIIPALILEELEKRLGKEMHETFDLIAGTSTGGIIALGLGTPCQGGGAFKPADLVDLYVQKGSQIFPKGYFTWFWSLLRPKYSPKPLEGILRDTFGKLRFKSALKPLLVSSYDIEHQLPFFFKTQKALTDPAYDWDVAEIARATSAAPTFFPPARLVHSTVAGVEFTLVDGGVCVNNPAMAAFAEACRLFPGRSQYIVVSVGTGDRQDHYKYKSAKRWGLLRWAPRIVPVFMDSVSEAADYELENIPICQFFRLQPDTLDPASNAMDDASATNIANLQTAAQKYIASPKATKILNQLQGIL
jgi:patatin-like phospholipase/acyl hydrolase